MHGLDIVKNNNVISLDNEGFNVLDIKINDFDSKSIFEEIDGQLGRHHQGTTHGITSITVDIEATYDYELDFPLLRDKLQSLVSDVEPFYIREKRTRSIEVSPELPGETTGDMKQAPKELATGKQYKVLKTSIDDWSKDNSLRATTSITFETAYIPYAESIGTTKQLNDNGLSYDGIWAYGMGLYTDDPNYYKGKYKYSNVSEFDIFNAGDVAVDDYRMYRVIKLTVNQSASRIRLYDATGDYLEITRNFVSGDMITIDRQYIKCNGLNILNFTNYYNLKILTGWNKFKIEGVTSYTIEFDFRFYYGSKDLSKYISNPVVVVDTTPPNAPTVNDILASNTLISGSAEEGSTVKATFKNGVTNSTITSVNGTFSMGLPAGTSLTIGDTITFTATDKANNTSAVTTVTVKGNQYSAPVVQSTVAIDETGKSDNIVISNLPVGKDLVWEEFNADGTANGYKTYTSITSTSISKTATNMKIGMRVDIYVVDPPTKQQLSDKASFTIVAKSVTVMNLWRSSTKDYTNIPNTTGTTKFTEIFSVIGNNAQPVHVKTVGDSVIVTGNAEEMRFYLFENLKPDTTYTLSYKVNWTDTGAGLHTHAWGVGVLYEASKNTRQHFTFKTNSYGRYGYGNGAGMDAPASSLLNAMHHSTNTNEVTYSEVTLNEGSSDLGYSAGTATGV